jgi:hypothetical protein
MQPAAEQVLSDVLKKYGSSACDTPQLLETCLRKSGRSCLHEVDELIAALRCGIVTDLRADHAADRAALARVLAIQAKLTQPHADWVVKAWSAALAKAPARVSAVWPPTEVKRSDSTTPVVAVGMLVMAAATAVIAYHTFLR